jgi:aspartate carbamoyltransferase
MKQPLAPIVNDFKGKDIVSLSQFDRPSVETVFSAIQQIKTTFASTRFTDTFKNYMAALMFFEPSSRTFLSFSTAVKRMGGHTLENQNAATTSSTVKGETLEDMAKVLESYADILVIRHPEKGSVEKMARAVQIPVLNAGDGAGEHPTQALMDMFTIYEKFGKLDGIKGLIAGDLLYGRTVHSLLKGLSLFNDVTIYLMAPQILKLDPQVIKELQKTNITLVEIENEEKIPQDCNFWYWTRVQKERFTDVNAYEQVRTRFILSPKLIETKGNENLILMHPLPRVGEIDERVDADPRAIYLSTQIQNGVYTRMALLSLVTGTL